MCSTLTAVGSDATLSLLVSEGSNEIAIRMALGAESRTILASMVREGLVLAAGGIAIGLGAAALLSRVVATLLYGVTTLIRSHLRRRPSC